MSEDRWALHDLLCRFQRSFDAHDWPGLRACLEERLWCDYSSFRAVAGDWIEADRYVRQRQAALGHLRMQHNFLNLQVTLDGDAAEGRCNYLILRFAADHAPDLERHFHSGGCYRFGFVRGTDGTWRIAAITQTLLASWGDPELHGATRQTDNTRFV